MAVFDAFGDALSLLRRHPKLVGYLFVTSIVSNVLGSGEYLGLSEGANLLLSFFSLVVGPAITVGVVGMINDAAETDRVSLGSFAASVLQNYFSLLGVIYSTPQNCPTDQ